MEHQPTVYLLQEPTSDKDLSSAAKHGRIVPIIGAYDKPAQNIPQTMNRLAEALANYNPQHDTICFAGGDPLVEFLAGIILERMGFDEITHLLWNRERGEGGQRLFTGFYMPKRISLVEGDTDYYIKEK